MLVLVVGGCGLAPLDWKTISQFQCVRNELEDEFRLSNVAIEHVKFQDFPDGRRIEIR
jgi:hypothetical protein